MDQGMMSVMQTSDSLSQFKPTGTFGSLIEGIRNVNKFMR